MGPSGSWQTSPSHVHVAYIAFRVQNSSKRKDFHGAREKLAKPHVPSRYSQVHAYVIMTIQVVAGSLVVLPRNE